MVVNLQLKCDVQVEEYLIENGRADATKGEKKKGIPLVEQRGMMELCNIRMDFVRPGRILAVAHTDRRSNRD